MKKINPTKKKKTDKLKYNKSTFSVVKFPDEKDSRIKLFECIPELWFVNEEKTLCFWPPKSGKSFTLRVMNQEPPDDTWDVYECTVVSEGHGKFGNYSCFLVELKYV